MVVVGDGMGDGELATALPGPARVTLELWEHNKAKGKVELWETTYCMCRAP